MKRITSLTLAALASLGLASSVHAQSFETNLVQTLVIDLFGLTQGPTTTNGNHVLTTANTVAIGRRDIIAALGALTANNFSPAAVLELVTPLPNGTPYVVVQDGSNRVSVAGLLNVGPAVGGVETSDQNNRTGRLSGNTYTLEAVSLQDPNSTLSVQFTLTGIAVESFTANNGVLQTDDTLVQVAGSGSQNGNAVVLEGTVHIFWTTLELVPVVSSYPPPS